MFALAFSRLQYERMVQPELVNKVAPMSRLNTLLTDVETALERLNAVYLGLKELKDEIDEVEKARDRLRGRKPKNDKPH
jgi:hypothetical protein